MIRHFILIALFCLLMPLPAAHATDVPKAYFVNLKNGDMVTSPVNIEFGIKGMEIAPAGTDKPNTGHFHLLIDTPLSAEDKTLPIPKDAQHLHFGKGQTEAMVELKPGQHRLQLVMGDGNHMLHKPPVVSKVITITVQKAIIVPKEFSSPDHG